LVRGSLHLPSRFILSLLISQPHFSASLSFDPHHILYIQPLSFGISNSLQSTSTIPTMRFTSFSFVLPALLLLSTFTSAHPSPIVRRDGASGLLDALNSKGDFSTLTGWLKGEHRWSNTTPSETTLLLFITTDAPLFSILNFLCAQTILN